MIAAKRSNQSLAWSIVAIVAGMTMLSFASVPLYRLFCEYTGFAGTTQRAKAAPGAVAGAGNIRVRFNADIDGDLPWNFAPGDKELVLKLGEEKLTYFTAENRLKTPTAGHATYNVLPEQAGAYFNKIECFCFKDQTLEPGQRVEMPVSFFIDPEIVNDPNLKGVQTITLSYTFFPAKSDATTTTNTPRSK